jgi:hypothetical protein
MYQELFEPLALHRANPFPAALGKLEKFAVILFQI